MRVVVLAGFILGCAAIVAAFVIGWANWGKLANQEIVMQILMGALVIVVLFLGVMAIPSKGKECGEVSGEPEREQPSHWCRHHIFFNYRLSGEGV
jgi:hypothetical protein